MKGGYVTDKGKFVYSTTNFNDNLALIEDLSRVKFTFHDRITGHKTTFVPNFNVCACKKETDSLCDYDNPESDLNENLFLARCICTDAFDGRFCQEDKDRVRKSSRGA